jgi:tryptophan synthase beta subunit
MIKTAYVNIKRKLKQCNTGTCKRKAEVYVKKKNQLTTGAHVNNAAHSWQRNTVRDTLNEQDYKHSCLM